LIIFDYIFDYDNDINVEIYYIINDK